MVPSFVADLVMPLLQPIVPGPAPESSRVRRCWKPASENRLGESYDKASLFRGRKSRPRAACCKTSARQATSVRSNPLLRQVAGAGLVFPEPRRTPPVLDPNGPETSL